MHMLGATTAPSEELYCYFRVSHETSRVGIIGTRCQSQYCTWYDILPYWYSC